MKIGVSSAVLYPQESEQCVNKILNMGFDTLEFFFDCEYEMSECFIKELGVKLSAENAQVVSVHPYTAFAEAVFFFSEYKRRTDEYIEKYCKYFRIAKQLGAKYFTFHGDRKGSENNVCTFSDKHCEVLNRLAKAAKMCDITLCLENVSWCKSSNLQYLEEVKCKVPDIGFTLDLKQARRAKIPIDYYIDVMGDKIKNIHISDFDVNHDCLLPGEGDFNFSSFFKKIKKCGYSGDVIIEVYSSNFKDESQIMNSKRFLEEIIC